MKTEKLVALRNIYYDRDLKEGEEFDAREEHVQPLILTKAARVADVDEADKSKKYNRRDMRAEK